VLKFRTRPQTVEAFQFGPLGTHGLTPKVLPPAWKSEATIVKVTFSDGSPAKFLLKNSGVKSRTAVPIEKGDWIVRRGDGSIEVRKPHIFEAFYEPNPEPPVEVDDEICCPVDDPDCMGGDGDCHWACEAPGTDGGDARCIFCDGEMPCHCPNPLSPEERQRQYDEDADARDRVDYERGDGKA